MFYGLISVAAWAVCMFQNFEAVEISPGFYRGPVTIAVRIGIISIFSFCLSRTFGEKTLLLFRPLYTLPIPFAILVLFLLLSR
jgi:hypothetical protein